MKYVALLRGINVGGNSTVEMSRLKAVFEKLGFADVRTYINSGNVIFSGTGSADALTAQIEKATEREFGFPVPTVIRSAAQISRLADAVPAAWTNDATMKTDVMFLWKDIDDKSVLDELTIKAGLDEVRYVAGAVVWRVDRAHVTKSGLLKVIGTPLYKKMTVRNVNTLRKLNALLA